MPPKVGFRSPYKFTSSDGTLSVVFPRYNYEYSEDQELAPALATSVGSSFAYDFQGVGVSPRRPSKVSVRFLHLESTRAAQETAVASMRTTLYRIGKGKLWNVDSSGGVERWCWARVLAVPSLEYGFQSSGGAVIPMVVEFARLSDWYDAAATTGSQAVNSTPTNFNITNPGDLPVQGIIWRFRSNAAPGLGTVITLVNNTNAYQIPLSGYSLTTANDEIKLDGSEYSVKTSADDGANYVDAYTILSIPASQVAFMELAPGVNPMTVTGTGSLNYALEWSFYGAYL